jgi:hypothetical protein
MPAKSDKEVSGREGVPFGMSIQNVDEGGDVFGRLVERSRDHVGDGFGREWRDGDVGRPRARAKHLTCAREELLVVWSEGGDEKHSYLGLVDGPDEGE